MIDLPMPWLVRAVSYALFLALPWLVLYGCGTGSCQAYPSVSSYLNFYLNVWLYAALHGYWPLLSYLLLTVLSTECWLALWRRFAHLKVRH
ncbi:MAG TPA: hypothetical protein DCS87_07505 [Rheinheimera sp.]|nr:hypothetical protein [Rheinheimera sp.]